MITKKNNSLEPHYVVLKLLEGLSNQDWPFLANLYAEEVVIQWPLAIPSPIIVRGRQSLQKVLQDGWKLLEMRASNIKVHETLDPEVVIAEYDYKGKGRDTGKVFHSANILVLTVRNSRIISARGYHNHLVAAAAVGTLYKILPQLEINPKFEKL